MVKQRRANLADRLLSEISAVGLRLERLKVQETDTSTVVYTRNDWMSSNRRLSDCDSSNVRELAV
jgi:hypothetical protein